MFYMFEKNLRRLIKRTPLGVAKRYFNTYKLIPVYHIVSDEDKRHVKHLYPYKSKKQFIKELDFFLENFKVAELNDVINSSKKNIFHLTFDDGFRECYDVIMPILREKGIPATFFINTDFINNQNMQLDCLLSLIYDSILKLNENDARLNKIKQYFDPKIENLRSWLFNLSHKDQMIINNLKKALEIDEKNYLKTEQPYLNSTEIQQLVNNGFTVGSHGKDHTNYKYLSLDEQTKDTITAVQQITTEFDQHLKTFAFPYEDVDISFDYYQSVDNCIDASFGTSGLYKDHAQKNFQRVWMESPDNDDINQYITNKYRQKLLRNLVHKNDYLTR